MCVNAVPGTLPPSARTPLARTGKYRTPRKSTVIRTVQPQRVPRSTRCHIRHPLCTTYHRVPTVVGTRGGGLGEALPSRMIQEHPAKRHRIPACVTRGGGVTGTGGRSCGATSRRATRGQRRTTDRRGTRHVAHALGCHARDCSSKRDSPYIGGTATTASRDVRPRSSSCAHNVRAAVAICDC